MVRVWVSGYTWAISERFRDKELIYKALYKFGCLLYFVIDGRILRSKGQETMLQSYMMFTQEILYSI